MTDTPTFRLIYRSHNRIPSDRRKAELGAIFSASADGEHNIPLLANAAKGGITPAAPRPTTPEQDEVLDFMRRTLGDDAHAR